LGLAIVQAIVERAAGTVTAKSSVGSGSVFSVHYREMASEVCTALAINPDSIYLEDSTCRERDLSYAGGVCPASQTFTGHFIDPWNVVP
jgi:hypothetical protein